MPSTYTTNNGIELIATGEQSGTWGSTTNNNLTFIDTSLDGHLSVTLASAGSSGSPNTLPITDGSASNGRNRAIIFTDGGDLGADVYVQLTPNDAKKIMFVRNSLSGSRNLILFQGTYNASNDFVLAAGKDAIVKFDGAGAGAVASAVLADLALDAATIGTLSATTINATTVNATTFDMTNLEVTNIKAKDGTAAGSIADSTGVVTFSSVVLTTADINGGTIDGVSIGASAVATVINVDNLSLDGNTIASTNSNGNVVIAPNGTGDVQLDADTVRIGDSNADVTVTTNGTGDLILNTNAGADSGIIRIYDGSNGNIALTPNGTGEVDISKVDIDGGSIDGTTIGAASAAAGTFTTVTASGDVTIADKIVHDGDTNTAIRFPAADTVTVETAGSERMRITSAGNVGIGTAAPVNKLDVLGEVTAGGFYRNADVTSVGAAGVILDLGARSGSTLTPGGAVGALLDNPATTGALQFYSRSSNTLTERMRIDSSGNVGIGTTDPTTLGGGSKITVNQGADGNIVFARGGSTRQVQLGTSSTMGYINVDNASGGLGFNVNATERARIDSSGNVGIGVTPSAWASSTALQIGATSAFWNISGNGTQVSNNYAFTSGGNLYIANGYATTYVQNSSGEHVWYIAPSGTAGNAITFTQAMTLSGTSTNATLKLSNGTSGSGGGDGFDLIMDGTAAYVWNREDAPLLFGTNNTERARIDSSGNLGIGTTSPSQKLQVNGGFAVTGAYAATANGGSVIVTYGGSTGAIYSIDPTVAWKNLEIGSALTAFSTGGTERARIDSSGNLLVGTTTPLVGDTHSFISSGSTQFSLRNSNASAGRFWQVGMESTSTFLVYNDANAGVYLTYGGTSWTANSDERMKTTLVPFEDAVGKVCSLRAGTGRYLTDDEGVSRSFLIAQDVQAVLPEAVDVRGDEQGTLGLRYTDVVPLLVAAIKEQQAIITALEARITALEG